jgi:sugar (pentulose or hexulose) kinase
MSSLLIDLGGSDLKTGIVGDRTGEIESFTRFSMPDLIQDSTLQVELITDQVLQKLMPTIRASIDSRRDITNILISGQMGCWTLQGLPTLDGRLVSWQDRRILFTAENLQQVISGFCLNDLIKRNGNEIGLGVPLVGMISMLKDLSNFNERMRFQSLISLITSRLTHTDSVPMHVSDAAASGLVDLDTSSWNESIISNLFRGIDFPQIVETLVPVGSFERTGVDVYCGIGDQQASLLGVGISDNVLVLNIGTGGQVATLREGHKGGNIKIRPFFDGRKIFTITHLLSGRFLTTVLEIVYATLDEIWTHADLNLLTIPPKAKAHVFEFQYALDRQYLMKIARELGARNFLQSAILTMALSYVRAIEELGGVQGRKLIFAGGVGQKNRSLVSVIRRELKNPDYEISTEIETTLAGLRNISKVLRS